MIKTMIIIVHDRTARLHQPREQVGLDVTRFDTHLAQDTPERIHHRLRARDVVDTIEVIRDLTADELRGNAADVPLPVRGQATRLGHSVDRLDTELPLRLAE